MVVFPLFYFNINCGEEPAAGVILLEYTLVSRVTIANKITSLLQQIENQYSKITVQLQLFASMLE